MRARKPDHNAGQSGFTLVEMLIVLTLIAILGALVVPQLNHYRHKAAVAAAQGTAHCLETGFTNFDPTSNNLVDQYPRGVIDQTTLVTAARGVGCKVGTLLPLDWKNCQMIFICPDGREISASCSTDPDVVCGPNTTAIQIDYEMTLGVHNYADTIVISSREPMITNFATTITPPVTIPGP